MDTTQRLQSLLKPEEVPHHILAQYPHLAERVAQLWGTQAMDIFLNDLFFDRRGSRQGFSPEVMHELFMIQSRHNQLFPPKEVSGIWSENELATDELRAELATYEIPRLIEAAKAGELDLILQALSHGVYIESADQQGLTMLWWAARYGHRELIMTLLKARAAVAVADEYGCQAIHWLAAHDLVSVLEEIIQHGADLNALDFAGMTPLMHAVRRGRVSAAGALLRLGAAVNAQDQQGMSALHFAAEAGTGRLLELLMAYHADPELQNCQQKTALDLIEQKSDSVRLKMYLLC